MAVNRKRNGQVSGSRLSVHSEENAPPDDCRSNINCETSFVRSTE